MIALRFLVFVLAGAAFLFVLVFPLLVGVPEPNPEFVNVSVLL